MYKYKYEKYKRKYLELKNIQEGGEKNLIETLPLDKLLTINLDTISHDVLQRLVNSKKQSKNIFDSSIQIVNSDIILAEGGFGQIFIVRTLNKIDSLPKDSLAIIKVFNKNNSNNGDSKTFAEYETAGLVTSNLSKCNIPKIYAYFEEGYNNYPTILMEYVKGTNLTYTAHNLALNIQSLDLLSSWISQIETTIRCLHDKGIVHRDIKTDNIMISPDLQIATLVDYGLACAYGSICSPIYANKSRSPLVYNLVI